MSDRDERPGEIPLSSRRRRERPQLSCNLCRRRKLRCDRQQPCRTCTHRGLGLSCTYVPNSFQPADSAKRPPSMHERIQELESLVVDLMQKTSETHTGEQPSVPEAPPSPQLTADRSTATGLTADSPRSASPTNTSDCGSMRFTESGVSYVNGSHWAAVLDGIAELKDHFENEKEDEVEATRQPPDPSFPDWTGPQLLCGCTKPVTKEELLASIPARPVVDRLVSGYFNSFEMSPAVLHSGQFLKEYEEFWKDPGATPVMWLGLLFTIMCFATQFERFKLDPRAEAPVTISMEQDLQKMVESFRQRIVQCLVLGNYAKGGPYVLETLMLYVAFELFLRTDAEIGIWILLGTVVQLAMHMGYHRDSKHFKGMSPFVGEMRRRVWATVVGLDLVISAQMGLPQLIKPWQTDTCEPLNLQDGDFDATTTDMPPSRPETDLTPMLYRNVKTRMVATVGFIWDLTAGPRSCTYADVMKMDKRLHDGHESIPECLKWRSMTQCIMDSPQLIIQKVFLEIVFHAGRIVLHRRYMGCSPTATQYSHSKQTCLDAALKLLGFQRMFHEETQPLCRLYQERWRVSSLIKHDFLLATSVLCSFVLQSRGKTQQGTDASMVETVCDSLRRSYDIWLQSSGSSKEAQKAMKALGVVLGSHHNISGLGADVGPGTTLENISPHVCINASHYRLENPAGLCAQFPAFDATTSGDWPSLANEPAENLTLASNIDWRMMDTTGTISSPRWPWDGTPY